MIQLALAALLLSTPAFADGPVQDFRVARRERLAKAFHAAASDGAERLAGQIENAAAELSIRVEGGKLVVAAWVTLREYSDGDTGCYPSRGCMSERPYEAARIEITAEQLAAEGFAIVQDRGPRVMDKASQTINRDSDAQAVLDRLFVSEADLREALKAAKRAIEAARRGQDALRKARCEPEFGRPGDCR